MFYIVDLRGGKLKNFAAIVFLFIVIFITLLALIRMIFYPAKYKDLVSQYAREYNLDTNLVFAIIKTESKFNSKALSHKGAKGLMQITDQTGEWAAKEIGIKGYNNDKLYDPEINIQIGCWYIRRLLSQYKNNLQISLAAYNAGSGNVSKWLKNSKYSEDGESLKQIPFKETREYVQKVIRSRNIYKRLYRYPIE